MSTARSFSQVTALAALTRLSLRISSGFTRPNLAGAYLCDKRLRCGPHARNKHAARMGDPAKFHTSI